MSPQDPIVEALALCAELPRATVEALFARYGRPLDEAEPTLEPSVALGDEVRVGRLRHRSSVDVIANDHFVLERPLKEPLAMPGPLFAAAIAALTRRS